MKEVNRLRVLQGYMDGKILIEEATRILKRILRSEFEIDLLFLPYPQSVGKPEYWLPRRSATPQHAVIELCLTHKSPILYVLTH